MICAIAIILAAASPLLTGDDYIFTHPGRTNLISGTVMGDEPVQGHPMTMRYEDIAFLNEAVAERAFLFDATKTSNDLERVATSTNTVFDVPYISGVSFPEFPADLALASEDDISTGPRVISAENYLVTTIEVASVWSDWSTNAYTHATNFITQVMTNGTTDVWTNFWSSSFASNRLDRQISETNVLDFADLCMKTNVISLSMSGWIRELMGREGQLKLRGLYSKSQITNLYAAVRACRLSLPHDGSVYYSSKANATRSHSVASEDGSYSQTENVTRQYPYIFLTRSENTEDRQYKSGDEWVQYPGYPRNSFSKNYDRTVPNSIVAYARPRDQYVLTFKTDTPRISGAYAFANINVGYSRRIYSSRSTADGEVIDVDESKYENGNVMVPIGEATIGRDEDDRVAIVVNVPTDVYKTAADSSGVTFVRPDHEPELPPTKGPAAWYETGNERVLSTHKSVIEEFSSGEPNIWLILKFRPKTTLSDWD